MAYTDLDPLLPAESEKVSLGASRIRDFKAQVQDFITKILAGTVKAGDAALLNGAAEATTATANKIAKRDANGKLAGDILGNAATATLASDATELSTASGSAPSYSARAWVTFDGSRNVTDTGASTNGQPVKIFASGNVTSVTKIALGNFKVNFTTAMQDANYGMIGVGRHNGGGSGVVVSVPGTTVGTLGTFVTTEFVQVRLTTTLDALTDSDFTSVAVFR